MQTLSHTPDVPMTPVGEAIARHWGIRSLRPLQEPAIRAVLERRDSLVVLPTGGGKSLCYQAPAVVRNETTVVVSPLISLMKDQVDGLRSSGVNAVRLDSTLTAQERGEAERQLRERKVQLLFVSPERLVQTDMRQLLQEIDVQTFAIDEAHCISHWGHDFRPEYRQLRFLRNSFPNASMHAYTATATLRVRQDILQQLDLRDPAVLVGNFDRHNLTYRIVLRGNTLNQVMDVLARHRGEGGIIYCISRNDVNDLASALAQAGVKAMPYHAGMSSEQRARTQDAFASEACDVVVATVAFGMGIDRSNVRYVLHTGMPKSLEAYQQETGRAGRDGLEAECVLLHSGADFFTWKGILEKAAREYDPGDHDGEEPVVSAQQAKSYLETSLEHLSEMERYCRGAVCRHKALVQYFGQNYDADGCNACDHCLGETVVVPESQVVAQKILSCIARLKGSYGIGYIASVLRGERIARIREKQHDQLSTYGLLAGQETADIRDWIYQLIGQGALGQSEIETSFGRTVPVVKLNKESLEVMKQQREVRLMQPVRKKKGDQNKRSRADSEGWEGVDRDLFEELRSIRRTLAEERGVPPYIVFNDATLRDLSRIRPSQLEDMRRISGIGDAKLKDFGKVFNSAVKTYCQERNVSMDQWNV